MYRARLIALLALLAAVETGGCKKDQASTAQETAPLAPQKQKPVDAPNEIVYAASSALRVVDTRLGKVVSGVPLSHTVYSIEFSLDGSSAYVATGAGIFEIDAALHQLRGQLTDHPASYAVLDQGGSRLDVLEHEVIVHKDGTRDIQPFHWVELDLASGGKLISDEEIGQRITFVVPPRDDRYHLLLTADGEVRLGKPKTKLRDSVALSLAGMAQDGQSRVRSMGAVKGSNAYIPVEASPSQIVDVDLSRGDSRAISLERPLRIRGLAVTPDGKSLLVNAIGELLVVDLEKRRVRAAVELPGAHIGLSISDNGRWAFMAQTVDGTGGAVTIVRLDPLSVYSKIHLDDISPWAIAVKPRAGLASADAEHSAVP
jgi:hypothetical protein